MYPRHRVDVRAADLVYALAASVWARDGDRRAREIERSWAGDGAGEAFACFSVRTGLDLLLDALDLPRGSEVLVSAVTHPDVVRIVERHGLKPLPVDLDLETLVPRLDVLEAAVSPRTRMILVAQLFGARFDLAPVAELASRHDLVLVEDCAQTIRGPSDTGDALADVSMFSFGSIKTATALGGALLRLRDAALLAAMREIERTWPVQPRREFAGKALKFLALQAIAQPTLYGVVVRLCRLLRVDFDALVSGAVRAFTGDEEDFFAFVRHRPSAPLLALLARRLRRFDSARLARRAAYGEELAAALPPALLHPGAAAPERTHWVFPLVAGDPASLIAALRAHGFDATRGTSAIAAVPAPADRPDLVPHEAVRMMSGIVFVPAYPEIPESALGRLAAALREAAAAQPGPARPRIPTAARAE